jgi:hypothetical protein
MALGGLRLPFPVFGNNLPLRDTALLIFRVVAN